MEPEHIAATLVLMSFLALVVLMNLARYGHVSSRGMVSSMSLSSLDFPTTHAEVSQARVVVMDAAQDLVQHSLVSGGQQ